MSDDGHGNWDRANPEAFTEVLIPRAFLAASAVADEPSAPSELDVRLGAASSCRRAAGDCVRVHWPVALLPSLAEYADDCARVWGTGHTWRTAHIAAGALAEHARHHIARESD